MPASKKLPPLDPAELSRRITAANGTRAPLVVWMIENHDELERIIAVAHVNWDAVTEYVTGLGASNSRGQPLTKRNVRNCWLRAKKAVNKNRTGKRPLAISATTPAIPPTNQATQPEPEPKFKFASLRNGGRGVSAEELRALGDPSAPADPNDPRWKTPPNPKPR